MFIWCIVTSDGSVVMIENGECLQRPIELDAGGYDRLMDDHEPVDQLCCAGMLNDRRVKGGL